MYIYTPLSGEDLEIFESLKTTDISNLELSPANPSELNPMYGQKHTEETKQLMSLRKLGKKHSQKTKLKMSKTRKGVPKPKGFKHNFLGGAIQQKRLEEGTHNFLTEYVCPHCNKIGKSVSMLRWHFDNCRSIYTSPQ